LSDFNFGRSRSAYSRRGVHHVHEAGLRIAYDVVLGVQLSRLAMRLRLHLVLHLRDNHPQN